MKRVITYIRNQFVVTKLFAYVSTVLTALWQRVWNRSVLHCWNKFNCYETFSHSFTNITVPRFNQFFQTKEMICTYWRWLGVTIECEIKQGKLSEPARSVQCAGSRKTVKYINTRYCVKPEPASLCWSSRTPGQSQMNTMTTSTGIQWCYVRINAGNLRLPEAISLYPFTERGCPNQHYRNFKRIRRFIQSELFVGRRGVVGWGVVGWGVVGWGVVGVYLGCEEHGLWVGNSQGNF
jgi:hypothetical protein